jgi:hypothetical protein
MISDKGDIMAIDHSIPDMICLFESESNPKDSISLENLRAQARLYAGYAALVNRFLDFFFVLREAPKYGIVRICFYDPKCFGMDPSFYDEEGWKDGSFAKIRKLWDRKGQYEIFLNPFLDLQTAARELSKRTGLRIKPEEVHYYSWFHECGHTRKVAGDYCPGRLLPMYLRSASEASIRDFKSRAERIADAWAVKELRRWRRRRPKNLTSPLLFGGRSS